MIRMLCLAAFAAAFPNVARADEPPAEDDFEVEIGEELQQPLQDLISEENEKCPKPAKRPAVVKPKPPEPEPEKHEHPEYAPIDHDHPHDHPEYLTEPEGDARYSRIGHTHPLQDHEHQAFDAVVFAVGAGGGIGTAPGLGLTDETDEFSGVGTLVGRVRAGGTFPMTGGIEFQGAGVAGNYVDHGGSLHALGVLAPTGWLRLGAGLGGQGARVGVEDGFHQGAFWGASAIGQVEVGTPFDDDHRVGVSGRLYGLVTPSFVGTGINTVDDIGGDIGAFTVGLTFDVSAAVLSHGKVKTAAATSTNNGNNDRQASTR